MTYRAPVKDMLFCMTELARLDEVARLPGFGDFGADTAQAVLEECAKFNEGVVAPLNVDGDVHPSTLKDGVVTTTAGFKEAFRQFGEGGWQGLQHPAAYGGQGLPKTIGAACIEMLNSANLSFALCPLLTDGAIEALLTAGSAEQQQAYIPKMIDGSWTGTMNLTEPQAGSDLALVRTRAEPQADGSFKLYGTKIFITYGEHDMAENIVHLVLARVAGAPEGVKGISLFVVPKIRYEPSACGSARVRTAARSLPACGSVRFIVPVHSPEIMRGSQRCFSSSEPAVSSASIAPSVSIGHSAKLRLALLPISVQAAPIVFGRPWPPNAAGCCKPCQPPSVYWR